MHYEHLFVRVPFVMFAPAETALQAQRDFDAFEHDLGETMGQVNASAARLVGLVERCIERRWWEDVGTNSPENWVAVRCGVTPSRAHRLVRIARRLGDFPVVAARRRGLEPAL